MSWMRLGRTDLELVGATLGLKALILIGGLVAVWIAGGHLPDPLSLWDRWDGPHFTDIAVFGYMAHDPGTLSAPNYRQVFPGDADLFIVFLPLYPWLVGAANAVVGWPLGAAFLVSGVASVFVGPMLYRLVAADLGERIGRRSAFLLLVFPTAYFLHIGYTESLFLALAFASLWQARSDRWLAAGLLGGLAALTRANGLVLIPALAVEAWLRWRESSAGATDLPDAAGGRAEHRAFDWRWPAALALVAAGFAIYLGVNWVVYGDPLAFATIQREHWFKQLAPPWVGIGGMIGLTAHEDPDWAFMLGWVELLFTGIALAATVASVWLRPTWAAWMAGNWLLITSTGYVQSVPRYSLALFVIPVLGALLMERSRPLGIAWLVVSMSAMAYFAARFAIGWWAF